MRTVRLVHMLTVLLALLALPATAIAVTHHSHKRHHHRRHHRHGKRHRRVHARRGGPTGQASASGAPGSNLTNPGPVATVPPTPTTSPQPAPPSPQLVPAPVISGTTYYVSPTGSDTNPGTSPTQAWKTVARANRAGVKPGDGILFQGGATFSDSTLMPNVSGSASAPIVFGSYGNGQAAITMGVWFVGHDYLTFDDLALGPQTGLQGGRDAATPANHITVQRCTINLGGAGNPRVGIYSYGNNWSIQGNTVEDIGNSGMLLTGDSYTISGNTIDNTGLDSAISFGKHGIYLKVSNALVSGNTITHFSADGISPRFRNSTITGNHIANGAIGIGFFEYDTIAGTSHWTANTITNTSAAGIYVTKDRNPLIESFVITGNTIQTAGQPLNLTAGSGTYTVSGNIIK